MKVAIGIDVHKMNCAAYAVRKDNKQDKTGYLETINRELRRFRSNIEGFEKFETVVGHEHEIHILIENSSKSHDTYWILKNMGYDVIVAHATDLYRITKSNRKNDDNDAMELAHYMRRRLNGENEFQESFIPTIEQMRLRSICRFLADQKNRLTDTKKQIRSYTLMNGIHDLDNIPDVGCTNAMRILAKMDDPLPRLYAESINRTRRIIDFTEKTIRQEFYDNRMFDILYSIPGFGLHTASYLASIIIDIGRFQTKEGFSSYFGVRPSQHDSADSLKSGHISHRGDSLARRLAYQATFVHIFRCPNSFISEKYRRLIRKGKHHREAIIACTNSMLMMVHTLLRENRIYTCDPKELAMARAQAERMDIDYEEGEIPEMSEQPTE